MSEEEPAHLSRPATPTSMGQRDSGGGAKSQEDIGTDRLNLILGEDAVYTTIYNGGPKSSDLIGSQLLYNERIHNCYDARSFCESLHITPRLEVESYKVKHMLDDGEGVNVVTPGVSKAMERLTKA